MRTNISEIIKSQTPLRAIVEIAGGELVISPIAESDGDCSAILDALRFLPDDTAEGNER